MLLRLFYICCGLFFIGQNLLGANSDAYYVEKVSRYSNLDENEYLFKVTLNNQQAFEVPVTLEDLLANKIYQGMPFQLKSEEFTAENPSFSTFIYTSLDDTFELRGIFDSIHSQWQPNDTQPIITLVDKWVWRSGMSNYNYSIRFSDGSGWNVGYELYYSNLFNVGDKFFKAQPQATLPLVNVADGRVITASNQSRFIKLTW